MPLDSKNDGPPLQVGDLVLMDWVIARLFPSRLNVVRVARRPLGSEGVQAGPPPASVSMRIGTRPSAVTMVPPGAPMEEGASCTLLWRVAEVYAATGTVRCERDGLTGVPGVGPLTNVTLSAGARAIDLEWVAPETVSRAGAMGPWQRAATEPVDGIEPDMLPYGFDPTDLPDAPEVLPPVIEQLLPDSAALGSPDFTLRVLGSGFDIDSVIIWNGGPEPTVLVSPSEVTTQVDMSTAAVAIPIPVQVENLSGVSNTLTFELTEAVTRRGRRSSSD